MDLSGLSRRPGLLHLPIYRLAFLAALELLQRGKGLGKGSREQGQEFRRLSRDTDSQSLTAGAAPAAQQAWT